MFHPKKHAIIFHLSTKFSLALSIMDNNKKAIRKIPLFSNKIYNNNKYYTFIFYKTYL